VDCAIQVSSGDEGDDQEVDLDVEGRVDCAIQVGPGFDPKKETATKTNRKLSLENKKKVSDVFIVKTLT